MQPAVDARRIKDSVCCAVEHTSIQRDDASPEVETVQGAVFVVFVFCELLGEGDFPVDLVEAGVCVVHYYLPTGAEDSDDDFERKVLEGLVGEAIAIGVEQNGPLLGPKDELFECALRLVSDWDLVPIVGIDA